MKRYAGFGGLKAVLYPNASKEEWIKLKASKEDLKLHPDIIELHELLQQHLNEVEYKQAIDSIKSTFAERKTLMLQLMHACKGRSYNQIKINSTPGL